MKDDEVRRNSFSPGIQRAAGLIMYEQAFLKVIDGPLDARVQPCNGRAQLDRAAAEMA